MQAVVEPGTKSGLLIIANLWPLGNVHVRPVAWRSPEDWGCNSVWTVCLVYIHATNIEGKKEKEGRRREGEGWRGSQSAWTHTCQSVAKVLRSDPGRSISAFTLASQPCLIFLCTNISLPNWRPPEAIRICTGGHGRAVRLPQEAGGDSSILPQRRSEPVLQRASPQFRGQQGGKGRQQLTGRQRPLGFLWSPVHFRKCK